MWWVRGHHVVIAAVKVVNACCWETGTTTLRRTGSMSWIMGFRPFELSGGRLEGRERALPELVQVAAQHGDPGWVRLVQPARADLSIEHEPDILQHLQVLRHGGTGHRQAGGELADRQRAVADAVEDEAARGIPQGLQHLCS